MTSWLMYAVLVSGLLTLAALLTERMLHALGRPVRWVWSAAMVASVGLPALLGLAAARTRGSGAVEPSPLSGEGPALQLTLVWPDLAGPGQVLEPWVLPVWTVSSFVLAALLLAGIARLRLRAARWPTVRLPEGEALLSEDFGPALIGGIPARVVLPRWALHLGPRRLRMIMAHEEEHLRAGDVPLLLGGALLVAVAPWNPFAWVQLRRLRAAVELDCDRRVLGRGMAPAAYARLLLDLAAGPRGRILPWAALATHPSLLERRLTMIVCGTKRVSRPVVAGFGFLAAALVFLACKADAPPLAPDASAETVVQEAQFKAQQEASGVEAVREPMIFLDGKRVTKAALEGLEPEGIDRVEVVKGGAAEALYGAEAAGGVIRIFLKGSGSETEGDDPSPRPGSGS